MKDKGTRTAAGIVMIADESGDLYQYEHYICPGCKDILGQRLRGAQTPVFTPNFCPNCGQGIEWRGPQEEKGAEK
jgi:hypothetical protein